MKHNKKRNTAFLYESLIKELTKAVVRNQASRKEKVISIIKEFFYKGSVLKEELDIYNSVLGRNKVKKEIAQRFLTETKKDFLNLNRKEVFNRQTCLIKTINESLSPSAFANFISNYKNIASVGAFFGSNLKAKNRLLIENRLISLITLENKKSEEMKHIDNLTYKTFVDKFNNTYSNSLREEQKNLLVNYITSFSDNGLGLKSFLNEEISRLKKEVHKCTENKKIAENEAFLSKTKGVLARLDSFSDTPITVQLVRDVFYIQDLVLEVNG